MLIIIMMFYSLRYPDFKISLIIFIIPMSKLSIISQEGGSADPPSSIDLVESEFAEEYLNGFGL